MGDTTLSTTTVVEESVSLLSMVIPPESHLPVSSSTVSVTVTEAPSTTTTNVVSAGVSNSFSSIPKIVKPNIRKRPRQRDTSEDDKDDQDESIPDINKIRELMEDQKYRSSMKNGGINSEQTKFIEKQPKKILTTTTIDNNGTTVTKENATEDNDKSIVNKAFSNFDVGKTVINDSNEDPLLLAYIEQKLQEQKNSTTTTQGKGTTISITTTTTTTIPSSTTAGGTMDGSTSTASSNNGLLLLPHDHLTAEDVLTNPNKLYELPLHLQKNNNKSLLSSLGLSAITTSSENGDVGTGGVILGGTGIAEVLLPDSYKEKNMQETERLKELLLAKKRRSTNIYHQQQQHQHDTTAMVNPSTVASTGTILEPSSDSTDIHRTIIGSYSANYSQHRKDYALSMREQEQNARQQRYNQHNHHHQQQQHPSSSTAPYASNDHSGHPASSTSHRPHHHHHRKPVSNDDQLFNRFKKQEIASLRNR